MCGEYLKEMGWSSVEEGSPPHVRGIFLRVIRVNNPNRITPACAGNIHG
ncbi:hypothetical protein SYNTR_0945 [Candidatus Syntrophocurvum alkaliphilum]|uniref:Uncharacterized protein n=1 Tax=Candidatus Syntrophocurvum alkaliphilum TaxID=2293317 RepID=A0A6I6D9H2_9FIRM|nr:hypothetical protein SYNTR_0945 [Candidatus Syntrophocurvum alkaliphilum]